jgi:hypothetical protein
VSDIRFGDTIRIRATAETETLGVAGRLGLVYGWTTPSVTGVQVIGDAQKDHAVSVQVDDQPDPLWLDPDLVEFVDHNPGTLVRIGERSYSRSAGGEWIEDTLTN